MSEDPVAQMRKWKIVGTLGGSSLAYGCLGAAIGTGAGFLMWKGNNRWILRLDPNKNYAGVPFPAFFVAPMCKLGLLSGFVYATIGKRKNRVLAQTLFTRWRRTVATVATSAPTTATATATANATPTTRR
jgi:hypothetical protein